MSKVPASIVVRGAASARTEAAPRSYTILGEPVIRRALERGRTCRGRRSKGAARTRRASATSAASGMAPRLATRIVPHLGAVAAGLDQAQSRPVGGLAKPDKHVVARLSSLYPCGQAWPLRGVPRSFGLAAKATMGVHSASVISLPKRGCSQLCCPRALPSTIAWFLAMPREIAPAQTPTNADRN